MNKGICTDSKLFNGQKICALLNAFKITVLERQQFVNGAIYLMKKKKLMMMVLMT